MKPDLSNEAAQTSHHGVTGQTVPRLGREAEAKLALESTRISPTLARLLCGAFLLTIFSVPLVQHGLEIRRNLAERRVEIARGEAPQTSVLPRFYNFSGEFPTLAQIRGVRSPQQAWALIPSAEKFQ